MEDKEDLPSVAASPGSKEDEMALESDTEMWKPIQVNRRRLIVFHLREGQCGIRTSSVTSPDGGFVLTAAKLGNGGVILVLFETPSGFALFGYDGVKLFLPGAIQALVSLFHFLCFTLGQASVLNLDTGVNGDLANMINKWIKPDQKLAVGKPEYKIIIESYLVDRSIIEATGLVYECDFNVKKHAEHLRYAGEHLKNISGIDFEDRDLLKLATALMIVSYPNGEQTVAGNLQEVNDNSLQI
ncbi:hypothetical protein BAE44_0001353 [Dichanthelium oligosanthes]|uniref:Uncharacterized protein n=1 Tax=Dichanthelium oligosanthes TaxID=888268 RepID=A0A1E5WJP6_9POAL|nr:hypothetical protein BAE44_0001353 [Dichanthelium oligosanthes]